MAAKADLSVANCPSCFSPYSFKVGKSRQKTARIIPGCGHTMCEECISSLASKTGQVKCGHKGCLTTVRWNNNISDFIPNIFLFGKCDSETLGNLSDCLQGVGDHQPTVNQPKVGMSVIARLKEDGKWYRAVVTNCCPTSVLFVDLGNSDQVDEVRSLPVGMDQLPGQAVLLDVVSGPTQNQLENLVSPEDVLRCRIVEIKESLTLGNPVASVEILDP